MVIESASGVKGSDDSIHVIFFLPETSGCIAIGFEKNQRKIVNIFLPIICIICFGCSKEPSH